MKADRFIFLFTLCGIAFLLGLSIGEAKPVPKVCPAIPGMSPISTRSTTHGEFCTYQPAPKAQKVYTVKL